MALLCGCSQGAAPSFILEEESLPPVLAIFPHAQVPVSAWGWPQTPFPSHAPISALPSHPGSDPQTQLSRLMKRNGLCQAEAEARIASQLPLDEKRKLASHVIDNSGDRESTRRQVLRLHARLEDSLDFLWARLALGAAVAGLGGLLYLLLQHFIS